jgi:hypothetical protein
MKTTNYFVTLLVLIFSLLLIGCTEDKAALGSTGNTEANTEEAIQKSIDSVNKK